MATTFVMVVTMLDRLLNLGIRIFSDLAMRYKIIYKLVDLKREDVSFYITCKI